MVVYDLKCEYKTNPLGIDALKPRLSWKTKSSERGILQTAYHIRVAKDTDDLIAGRNLLWDTNKIEFDQSIHVAYQGPPLSSRQRLWWQVRVWDNQDFF